MGNQLQRLILGVTVLLCLHCGTAPTGGSFSDAGQSTSTRGPSNIPPMVNRPVPLDLRYLMWPVTYHKVSQEFKPDVARGRAHDGIDISAPKGTYIYAPADGTVIYAGNHFHGYGNMIMIEHTPQLTTLFGHCQKLFVHNGEVVRRGSLIGLVGRTGRATAPHLHFEVRVNREPVDPLAYLR